MFFADDVIPPLFHWVDPLTCIADKTLRHRLCWWWPCTWWFRFLSPPPFQPFLVHIRRRHVGTVFSSTHLCNLKPLQCKLNATRCLMQALKVMVTFLQTQVGQVDIHSHWWLHVGVKIHWQPAFLNWYNQVHVSRRAPMQMIFASLCCANGNVVVLFLAIGKLPCS